MATTGPPPDNTPPLLQAVRQLDERPALSAEGQELLRFVREENKANRDYFTSVSKIAIGGISVLLTLALAAVAFFGWRTKQDMEEQAKAVTQAELEKLSGEIRSQIQSRVSGEFQTDKMQKMIHEVAQEETRTGLKNEVSSLRGDLDSVRADVNRYAMPRVLSPKQAAALSGFLQKHNTDVTVTVKVYVGDPEALEYAAELFNAIKAGDWNAQFEPRDPPPTGIPNAGMGLFVDFPGQPPNPDPKHPRPDEILTQALQLAGMTGNFSSGGAANRGGYSLSLIVGRRPRDLVVWPRRSR